MLGEWVLNYSWKAGPNRWGRPEFNATFSISFWNGLTGESAVAYTVVIYAYNTWYHVQCMYMYIHSIYMYMQCTYMSGTCGELRLAGVARLIGPDGKWSVGVKLYRRVCTMSIHIFTFMNVYVPCTYKYDNSCTCMYMLHTFIYIHVHVYHMYIHVHEFMNLYKHVQTCLYHV